MTEIRMTEWEDGMEIIANGHAGYGERGSDIVCAGVSALLYALVTYLRGTVDERGIGQMQKQEQEGYLWVRCEGLTACDASALAVIETGLGLIADAYPGHVRFTHREEKEKVYDGKSTGFRSRHGETRCRHR